MPIYTVIKQKDDSGITPYSTLDAAQALEMFDAFRRHPAAIDVFIYRDNVEICRVQLYNDACLNIPRSCQQIKSY
jgi:hypothetical protein